MTIADTNPTVDLAASQVTGVVGGPINLNGVENLALNGTDGVADAFNVHGYGSPTGVQNLTINGGDIEQQRRRHGRYRTANRHDGDVELRSAEPLGGHVVA